MLRRTTDLLDRHATLRTILACLLASAVFAGLLGGYAIPKIRSHSPDAVPLDIVTGYSPDEAYAMIARYGDDVRSFYVVNAFTSDTIGPLFFNLTIALISTALLRQLVSKESRWRAVVAALGIAALALDLAENVSLSILVARFPERLDALARVANALTLGKRAAVYGTWAGVVISAMLVGGKRVLSATRTPS